jgi:hypothetical protein
MNEEVDETHLQLAKYFGIVSSICFALQYVPTHTTRGRGRRGLHKLLTERRVGKKRERTITTRCEGDE